MSEGDLTESVPPPPLVYLGAILLGLGIDRLWPAAFLPPAVQYAIGTTAIVLSIVLAAIILHAFVRHKTNPIHHRPTTTIIDTGPFRYSRNPIYVGMTLLQIGIGILVDSAWILLMVVPAVWIIHRFVVLKEEAFLEQQFGETYLTYKQRVNRWL